jgi:hypothetical protein
VANTLKPGSFEPGFFLQDYEASSLRNGFAVIAGGASPLASLEGCRCARGPSFETPRKGAAPQDDELSTVGGSRPLTAPVPPIIIRQ